MFYEIYLEKAEEEDMNEALPILVVSVNDVQGRIGIDSVIVFNEMHKVVVSIIIN